MQILSPAKLVHYFDTLRHRILCGSVEPDLRSTKHARGVTCAACIGILRERAMERASSPDAAAAP